ncbi:hypothetical protein RWV98_14980 [Agathobaculum sp. NTUH-O15-33]|uniref:hypothetical protein n=1 Tax=Agathobaculum sp. NTUH-O15-33 TaxID=3079302 RepID=UPI002958D53A|nr:hypothetical protein [Agathobaculum sp. NTUH-O15-33]WNX83875.1 hypothetical protein RWV98_14980 [Agathobaculum sp. NTUH-O15-33]
MKRRLLFIAIFILSLASLAITMQQFWNMGIYVDEHGTTPSAVLGGDMELLLSWANLAILFFACILSGIGALLKNVSDK